MNRKKRSLGSRSNERPGSRGVIAVVGEGNEEEEEKETIEVSPPRSSSFKRSSFPILAPPPCRGYLVGSVVSPFVTDNPFSPLREESREEGKERQEKWKDERDKSARARRTPPEGWGWGAAGPSQSNSALLPSPRSPRLN